MALRKIPAPAAQSGGGLVQTIKTVLLSLAIVFVVRTVAAEPYTVPSGSMTPTLLTGDELVASKYPYGYSRFSAPLVTLGFSGRILGTPPARGDVVVFRLPRDPSVHYVKRVIGLPGDRVQMQRGELYINGTKVERRFVRVTEAEFGGRMMPVREYAETLPGGRVHPILKLDDDVERALQVQSVDPNNTREFLVPPGHFFMMGDNRDNSLDSRFSAAADGVGYVPFDNLEGRAEVLIYSRATETPWWKLWDLPGSFRPKRFFQGVS